MRTSARLIRLGFALALPLALAVGCQVDDLSPKAEKQLPVKLVSLMKSKGMSKSSPIMLRIFKEEGVLEIWKKKDTGRFDLVTTYNICKWSGRLGPKFMESDRQAPEGFYSVRPAQMNPKSSYHLSFNIGYPNAFDRVRGRTGGNLMVHGACSSAGCYSMSDEQVEEIFAFARDAFRGGQRDFQVQAFPFRMTPQNMARYRDDPNYGFWQNLKEGYDNFELTKVPPKVDVCEKRYVFNQVAPEGYSFSAAGACPPSAQPDNLRLAYEALQSRQQSTFSSLISSGGSLPAPQPSIAGPKEAAVIAKWQNARIRGERVSREAPYFSKPAIPTSPAPPPVVNAAPVAAPAVPEQSAQPAPVVEQAAVAPDAPAVQPAPPPVPTPSPEEQAGAFPPPPEAPATPEPAQQQAAPAAPAATQPLAERFAPPPPAPEARPEAAAAAPDAPQAAGQEAETPADDGANKPLLPLNGKKRPWWKLVGS